MTDSMIAYDTYSPLSADEARAVEGRAEIECLGDLQHQRRQILITLAPLKALHGPFGLYDDKRKQMLEAMKVRVRRDMMTDPKREKKLTETEIDSAAYADPQYATFLDQAEDARVEFIRQANDLSELEERIRSRELELSFATAEIRLQR